MAGNSNKEEPSTAPEPQRWYNLTLGSSFSDHRQSPKFCTLRYEFKPASIDKNQPGSLHRNKDNRVSVEFQNNQHGKPKLMFDGISEDYKDTDAVLFFDGETFRLERLHRAVKRLRHVRLPGESIATTTAPVVTSNPPVLEIGSPIRSKGAKIQSLSRDILYQNPVETERFGINRSESLGGGKTSVNDVNPSSSHPNLSTASSDPKNYELEEQIDILNDSDDDGDYKAPEKGNAAEREFTTGIDINVPHQVDIDDDMADVDVSGDEAESGPNAAEALRAQVNAEGRSSRSSSSNSSSSSSSGSSDSESGSGSSSSGTGSGDGDGDSINSI